MPLRHQDTNVHKEQTINILNLVISLSLRAFVAKLVFLNGVEKREFYFSK